MRIDDCLSKYHLILRAGYAQIEPTSGILAKVRSAVEENNQAARLEGLEDELNPEVLDSAKVEAFVRGLPDLPDDALDRLRDRVLYLNAPTLSLAPFTAITAEALDGGYSLTVPESPPGGLVQPVLEAEIDRSRARQMIERAREATSLFDQEVKQMESQVAGLDKSSKERSAALDQLSLAQWKRYAASMVWRDSSSALAEAAPEDRELAAEAQRAQEAAAEYITAPWVGMPGPG